MNHICTHTYTRRKIRLMVGNAKCRYLKLWPVKGLCGRCLFVRGPETPYPPPLYTLYPCRKIRLIDGNAKCCHLKKLTSKGTWRQAFICLRPRTSYPPHTLNTCIQYTYSLREGGVGESEPERRLEGQQFTMMGRKCQHYWLCLQSINSEKHLPHSPFTG